jgi:hypothetical protein
MMHFKLRPQLTGLFLALPLFLAACASAAAPAIESERAEQSDSVAEQSDSAAEQSDSGRGWGRWPSHTGRRRPGHRERAGRWERLGRRGGGQPAVGRGCPLGYPQTHSHGRPARRAAARGHA